mgnify:CR=1 FL=1
MNFLTYKSAMPSTNPTSRSLIFLTEEIVKVALWVLLEIKGIHSAERIYVRKLWSPFRKCLALKYHCLQAVNGPNHCLLSYNQ